MKIYNVFAKKLKNKNDKEKDYYNEGQQTKTDEDKILSDSLEKNINEIKNNIGISDVLIISKYSLNSSIKFAAIFIKIISEQEVIRQSIINSILNLKETIASEKNLSDSICDKIISVPGIRKINRLNMVIDEVLIGNTIILIDGEKSAVVIPTRKIENRPIESPKNEITILGPNDSFTENVEINVSMILKRLPISELKSESFIVGTLSKTKVRVLWIDGIANSKVVDDVKSRLNKINIDWSDGVALISELIEDKPWSIFPKYRQTERPDLATKVLADGNVVVLADNSPFAMVVPITFWDNFKSMDDYFYPPLIASFIRLLRYIGFFLACFITPLYLALTTYNHYAIPSILALTLSMGRASVAFPTVVEILMITILVEIIREGGLRMPNVVGFTIGSLAAVVIGQASVAAGYFSASSIAIVAVSTICSFAISSTTLLNTARLLNLVYIVLASFLGIVGLIMGIALALWYVLTLESFSVPYLYPILPFEKEGLKDTFIRTQNKYLNKRLKLFAPNAPYHFKK